MLVTLPSGDERLEPLLNLSPHGVAILLRAQRSDIQPGNFLPRVRFFTNGECTLQCQATVRDVAQVSLETGGLGLKLGLRLELLESPEPSQPAVDTYSEPAIITDTLQNLMKAKTPVWLHAVGGNDRSPPRATVLRGSAASGELVLRLLDTGLPPQEHGACFELRGECYGTRLTLAANVVQHGGDVLHLTWPTRLAVWRNRIGGRVRRLPYEIEVEFESPFTQVRRARSVIDLSARGLAFTGVPDDGLLVGMLLPSISIRLRHGLVRGRGVVRNVRSSGENELLVGVEFVGLEESSSRVLETFVDEHLHPHVRPAQASDLQRLWPIYEELGLFGRQHAALSPIIGRIETVRHSLLTRARDLCLHLVGGNDDTICGNAELLHTYSTTWSLQHVGARQDSQLSADQLVVPLVESGMRRKDFQMLHALLDPQRSRIALARLRGAHPDEESLVWSERVLVTEPEGAEVGQSADEVQEAGVGDMEWVASRLAELFRPLERQALDLSAAELRLDRMARRYKTLGLERRRLVRMAFSVTGPLGFALVELTTPGVCFTGQCDLARLFATRKDARGRRDALLALARDAARLCREQGRSAPRFLLAPRDAELLVQEGYVSLGERVEVVASRTGAAQIVNFINLLS